MLHSGDCESGGLSGNAARLGPARPCCAMHDAGTGRADRVTARRPQRSRARRPGWLPHAQGKAGVAALPLAKCEADVIHRAETASVSARVRESSALAVAPYVRWQQHGCHLACVSSPLFWEEERLSGFRRAQREAVSVDRAHPRRRTALAVRKEKARWPLTLRSTRLTTSTTG